MRKTWCGFRQSAIIETSLYLGIALLIDQISFSGNRFWTISPHPFWPIVLLISAQYGTSEGLFAALAATIVLLTGKLPQQTLSQDLYEYIFDISKNPLLWFTAAVLWGELRGRHANETRAIREELEATKDHALQVDAAYKQVAQLKEKLELKVAGQLKTAVRIYEAARGIDKLEPAHVMSGVSQLVRLVMNPEKFSLFLLKNGRLEVATKEAWSAEDPYSLEFSAQSTIYQEIIGRRRCLCCVNRDEEIMLGSEGMLAAPLVNSETGEVLGMMKIEKLGFADLNLSSVQTFKVLCDWIGTAYANALSYKDALAEKIFDQSTCLFSYGFFERQTAFLSNIAERVGFDISMIVLRLDNPHDLTDEQRSILPGMVGKVVQKCLRKTDLAFEHRQSASEHYIVLPNTSLEDSQTVCHKLLRKLSSLMPSELRHAQFSMTVQALYRHDRQPTVQSVAIPAAHGLFPASSFEWHSNYLTVLARRIGFDISVISIRPDSTQDWKSVTKAVGTVAGLYLREIDLAFEKSDPDGVFTILLPHTTRRQADIVSGLLDARINDELEKNNVDVSVTVGIEKLNVEGLEPVLHV